MIKTQPPHLIAQLIEQHEGLICRLCPKQHEVTDLIQASCPLSLSDLEIYLTTRVNTGLLLHSPKSLTAPLRYFY